MDSEPTRGLLEYASPDPSVRFPLSRASILLGALGSLLGLLLSVDGSVALVFQLTEGVAIGRWTIFATATTVGGFGLLAGGLTSIVCGVQIRRNAKWAKLLTGASILQASLAVAEATRLLVSHLPKGTVNAIVVTYLAICVATILLAVLVMVRRRRLTLSSR